MLRRLLRLASLCTFAALVLSLGACSKDPPGDVQNPPTQTEADDVMQAFAAMTATNNGGWLTEVKTIGNAHAWPAGPIPLARGIRGFGTNPYRDTTFVRGTMNWSMRSVYRDSLGVASGVFDTLTRSIDVYSYATGTVPLGTFLGSTGQIAYGHACSTLVDGFDDADIDFHGFGVVDSGLVTTTNDGVTGWYYVDTTSVLEYTFTMGKGTSAFPDSGDATFAAFVGDLRSPVSTDRVDTMDLLLTILFDGTETPIATLSENIPDPTIVFRYQINLTTGAVQRITTLARGGSGGYTNARRSAPQRLRVTAP